MSHTSQNTVNNLDSALTACDELIHVLENENRLLISGDLSQIDKITEDKVRLLTIIKAVEPLLYQYKEANDNTHAGADHHNTTGKVLDIKIDLLRDGLGKCRILNNKNGYIINACLSNTMNSLAIVRGQSVTPDLTYSGNGTAARELDPRTIAKI